MMTIRDHGRRVVLATAVATVILAAASASAHHSAAMFDSKRQVALNGTVREFQWASPHCYIQLLVQADGRKVPQEWSLEMAAPMYLYRLGWRPSTVKSGDKITVKINPLKDGSRGGLLVQATTADGRQLGNGGDYKP